MYAYKIYKKQCPLSPSVLYTYFVLNILSVMCQFIFQYHEIIL